MRCDPSVRYVPHHPAPLPPPPVPSVQLPLFLHKETSRKKNSFGQRARETVGPHRHYFIVIIRLECVGLGKDPLCNLSSEAIWNFRLCGLWIRCLLGTSVDCGLDARRSLKHLVAITTSSNGGANGLISYHGHWRRLTAPDVVHVCLACTPDILCLLGLNASLAILLAGARTISRSKHRK